MNPATTLPESIRLPDAPAGLRASRWNNITAIAGVVIKELRRRKDFYVLFVLTALITLVMGSVSIFGEDKIVRYLKEVCLFLIWASSLVIAITTTARQIPTERENRTLFPLLERVCPPEPRVEPEIDYLAKDYGSFRRLMLDRLAHQLGRVRYLSIADGKRLVAGLERLPGQIEEILAGEADLVRVAQSLAAARSLFFIGRVRGFPVAREGAQKFKEISYRHAEAYQTSELKHGPLALIDPEVPTVALVPRDELTERNIGALHEIDARKGPLVVITHAEVDLGEIRARRIDVPRNEPELDPILLTIPLQLLAYHAAQHLGHDIDKPRNLAKSVTVE